MVYNLNINLFGLMIMVIEFLYFGGVILRLECKVCFLYFFDEFIKIV